MTGEAVKQQIEKIKKRGARRVAIVGACVLGALLLVDVAWTFTGSGQWRVIRDDNGVKVYALKTPGAGVEQFKGTLRLHAALPAVVKLTVDPVLVKALGAYESRFLGGDENMSFSSFRMDVLRPLPFRPRESVFSVLKYMNPATHELLLQVRAVPDKLPPSQCCFRVTQMNNSWRFIPAGPDQTDVEWLLNEDLGGFVPDFIKNRKWSNLMFNFLTQMRARSRVYQQPPAK